MSIIEQGHVIDNWQQELLDRYMCTDTCPCLDYSAENGVNSKKVYENQQDLLLEHDRIFAPHLLQLI